MATLAASFLEDLEGLDEEEENEKNNAISLEDANEYDKEDELIEDAIYIYEINQNEAAVVVSDLTKQAHFIEILQRVRDLAFAKDKNNENNFIIDNEEEIELIEKCNQLVIDVDKEIINIHKFIRDIYSKRFPELESIVFNPLEYIAIVQRVKNEGDLTKIDLSDILPNTVIMAVTVAASMTTGAPLPPNELDQILGASEEAMQLADCRKDILLYLESRMSLLAPNLSVILGSAICARLITHSGGLLNLARMPAQNIMLVGASKKASLGYGSATGGVARGIIFACEIIQNTHPSFKNRAIKLVAGKCSLAARVDSFHESPGGQIGLALREQIIKSLIKAQEPPPAPQQKAMPVPDEGRKTKRGGKRYRRMKEKYGLSEYRKAANRLQFGTDEEENYGLETGDGFGMVNVMGGGYGKLKLQVKQQGVQIPKHRVGGVSSSEAKKQSGRATAVGRGGVAGSCTSLGGMASLAFTPIQGIELCNPHNVNKGNTNSKNQEVGLNKDKYFSSGVKFKKVEEEKALSKK